MLPVLAPLTIKADYTSGLLGRTAQLIEKQLERESFRKPVLVFVRDRSEGK